MKLTGNDVLSDFRALDGVSQKPMSGKLALAIFGNIKLLEPHRDVIIKAIQKIEEQKIEDKDKLEEEYKAIGEQEFEIADFKKIDASLFDNCNDITPAIIYGLQFMIND